MMKLSLLLMGMLMGTEVFCQEPARCCFDKEFYAVMGEVGGIADESHNNATIIDAHIEMAYDFYNNIQGMKIYLRNIATAYYSILDFQNRREYNWQDNGTCTYKNMAASTTMFPPCIPANATYLGPATLGYGQHTIKIHTWDFRAPIPGMNNEVFRMHLSVTQGHCIPVVMTVVGDFSGAPTELSLFYVNYQPGLTDHRHLLTIPTPCSPAPAH